ncbi:leucyl-tRNA synthetase [Candidatus Blochmanniella chromaiodes str. 640]|uniref:Leucine--tRNA ligase n=1 Tax=Candidatus Blochmanniella chromaiodes str. 640 TaxID=1240471 RepID=A0ABN4B2Y5_9ENTR|nr:leucine--tRNA ligase [Candidatus Blochmannia chromaiodes]AGC03593.1 leucyl-tRNA synthetase [Candidatus Blochmannia chromaiodes str. 640]
MHKSYSPSDIESAVQKRWYKNKTFAVTEDSNKEKYYCLSMIPYPSGKLHMGHVRNYTIGDVISRYQRMLGKNVLQPIGWDAFGLPAEHAAIKNNTDPSIWTYSNINYMKSQLQSLGFAYDWNRELITCHPDYYRWEQWFFTVLYKKGLVYKKTASVNWCSYHKTVLANEQVINNCCWRCHTPVKYKRIPQWFIRITNYADQLLHGLDQLAHWPEQVKIMQRNWIGRSEGVNVTFRIENSNDTLTIYMTRLDIFMGITYLVISTDHPIALQVAKTDLNVAHFIQKNDDFYTKLNKKNVFYFEKMGMPTHIYAIHPITNSKLPIWVANFVIPMECDGMGAAISIPAHNQQDWEFAYKYNLPIKPVIKNLDTITPNIAMQAQEKICDGILFNSGEFDGLSSCTASNAIVKSLIARGVAQYKVNYRLKDWGISRQRYWGVPIPMVTLSNGVVKPVLLDRLPVILPKNMSTIQKSNDGYVDNSLKMYPSWIQTTYKGQTAIRDTDTFDTFMESSWYYARYTCPHYNEAMLNVHAANYWLPVDQYIGGIEHAIMHLLYFRFYHKLMRDEGLVYSDEPAIRLLCQGMVLADSFYYVSPNGQHIWVDPTHVTIKRDRIGGIVKAIDKNGRDLIYDGMCKMSKSKNNGIDPNIIIEKYGADAVRFFIMFAAPIEAPLEWKESGIEGAQRFLKRIWNLIYYHIQDGPVDALNVVILNHAQKFIRYNVHKTIEKVTDDIDRRQSFNTALSAIMKLVKKLYNAPKTSMQDRAVLQEALLVIVRLLYPFTPHISFILWKALGGSEDIDNATWPIVDTQAIQNDRTLVLVQINGKMRHKIFVPLNSDKNVVSKLLETEGVLNKYLIGKKINNIIYVPNRVINIIAK